MKLKINGVGTCSDFLGVDFLFASVGRKFTAFDDESIKYTGKYKQSGPDNRKVIIKLDDKSRKKLKSEISSKVSASELEA